MPQKPLGASCFVLPKGHWLSVFECLCQRFPHIAETVWRERFEQQLVLDANYQALPLDAPFIAGAVVYYFRALAQEVQVPFQEKILFEDECLLVVDKPHFLATAPVGNYVEETALRRQQRRLQLPQLIAAHRLDRLTAGVLLLIKRVQDRDAYQSLFRQQQVCRVYEAVAPALPELSFPLEHASCLQQDAEHFFLMCEGSGPANSCTHIQVLHRGESNWHYRLQPETGRQHQLRVHMSDLGAPIVGDNFYPQPRQQQADDYRQPLQLLARSLAFDDPLTGEPRYFCSQRRLMAV